jgi:hypothetical protein
MKKILILMTLASLLMITAGCGNTALETPSSSTGLATLSTSYTGALTVEQQLVIGTINLQGTDLAVDVTMAKALLPLWQTLQSLESSDTAAAEEKTAVVEQIQETMTLAQIQAIRDMQITRQSMQEILQKQGMNLFGGPRGANASGTPSFQGGSFPAGGFGPADGGPTFVEGGPGGGGGFAGGGPGAGANAGAGLSQDQIATLRAGRTQNGGSFASTGMTRLVIQFLEEIITPATATPAAP